MCGIAGWVGAGGGSREVLDAMLRALEHRGPDDTGRSLDGEAALGMTRLSIIDLVTGQQPMTSTDGMAMLVFNGEIYNFRDLRGELQARGPVVCRPGAQGAAVGPGRGPGARPRRARALRRLRLHAGRALDLRRHREAAAGPHGDAGGRRAGAAALLDAAGRQRPVAP